MAQHRERYPEHLVTAASMPEADERALPGAAGLFRRFRASTNFFNAVRSRQPVVEDATFGLRAAGPALLANMSYYEGRIKHWDPVAMRVVEN